VNVKGFCNLLFVLFILTAVAISGCGGSGSSNRQLQSLTVSPSSTTAQNGQAQFTAGGQFSTAPMSVNPASVGWFQMGPVFDPPGSTIGLTVSSQPFTAQCFGFTSGTVITVAAIAPMDASMPPDESIPLQVFLDLAFRRTTTQEGGFVAATAQMTCP
jgi:hypothetical protein